MVTRPKSGIRLQFFELLFGDDEGWVCIATTHPELPKATFKQKFFQWPKDFNDIENYILKHESKYNVYFCVNLLSKAERKKENCLPTKVIWADLDNIVPDSIGKIPPTIVVNSSPGRWQAFWRTTVKLEPYQAEIYSKRIAYAVGADKGGWDLTQLFRVPLTKNHKYDIKPVILIERALEIEAPPLLFESLPKPPKSPVEQADDPDMPTLDSLPDPASVLYKFAPALRGTPFTAIFSQTPEDDSDWSKVLWRLLHICYEAGMDSTEVFSVARSAPCNKYERDGRPLDHLWRDVLKARAAQDELSLLTSTFSSLTMPQLVEAPASETFIDQYRDWAKEATDAVVQFHDLCAMILLSSIVSNSVRLETSYGVIVPNLWGMVLGDSTLSRKTTAMRMVIDLLAGMDAEMVVATDGTPEGLLSGLAERPNKTSIFYRDEISGFFDMISRRDYLAGMPETLTALYDVPPVFSRRLRKEVIHIESPAFVFFGGGVRDRVYESINEDYVLSGFLPRFLVVSGDTEMARLRRTGPASDAGIAKRARVSAHLADVYENYASEIIQNIGGQKIKMSPRIMAHLTPEAWEFYGVIEDQMVRHANESSEPALGLPTFERLTRSMLKISIVLAAERQTPTAENTIEVVKDDVQNAAWYIQDWGRYSIDLALNAGKRTSEKLLEKVIKLIEKNPGIMRSHIMRHNHFSKREADEVLITLEDRQMVRKEQAGRGFRYWIA